MPQLNITCENGVESDLFASLVICATQRRGMCVACNDMHQCNADFVFV